MPLDEGILAFAARIAVVLDAGTVTTEAQVSWLGYLDGDGLHHDASASHALDELALNEFGSRR